MSKRILIVDDSSFIRRHLRRTLESEVAWQVCGEAVDGEDALAKAAELHPDLIVLDMSMPKLNGLEAARHLRRTMPEIPLMMYSLHADTHLEKEARAAGIQSVLSKSVDPDVLLHEARVLLEKNASPV